MYEFLNTFESLTNLQEKTRKFIATIRKASSSFEKRDSTDKMKKHLQDAFHQVQCADSPNIYNSTKALELVEGKMEDEIRSLLDQVDELTQQNLALTVQINKLQKGANMEKEGGHVISVNASKYQVNEFLSSVAGGGGALVYAATVDGWQVIVNLIS